MDKFRSIWRLLRSDGYVLVTSNANGADVAFSLEEDLEGALLLSVCTKKASNVLLEQITDKATEAGELQFLVALRETLDKLGA